MGVEAAFGGVLSASTGPVLANEQRRAEMKTRPREMFVTPTDEVPTL
jgi:hypothetical protein